MAQLIPIFILIAFSIAILVLQRREINLAQIWMTSVIGAIIAWLSILFIFLLQNLELTVPYLITTDGNKNSLTFLMEQSNWIFEFLLLTLFVSSLFIDAGQLTREKIILTWSGRMLISALGLAVILSGSTLTFLISSAILDLFLFGFEQINKAEGRKSVLDLCIRLTGSLLIIFGESLGSELNAFLMLLGVSLRIGLSKALFSDPFDLISRHKADQFLDMILPLSSLAYIKQMGGVETGFWGKDLLVIIISLSVLLTSVSFIRNLKTGYVVGLWVKAFSGIVILALISGITAAILPIAIVMCVWGGMLSLESIRSVKLKIVILVLMLAMIGLPYTPTAGLWITNKLGIASVLTLLINLFVLLLLITGFRKFLFLLETNQQQDGWINFSMGVGPLFLLVMPWANLLLGEKMGINIVNVWWAGVFLLGVTFILLFDRNSKFRNLLLPAFTKINPILRLLKIALHFLSFKWLRPFLRIIQDVISDLIRLFNRAFEGDGGLLWAILFLILISSILVTYRLII